jgi:lathosterol oxidase
MSAPAPAAAPPSPNRGFGTGWISGTLSVALALAGLCGVLCFLYPSYLTTPEARQVYSVGVMRWVLHLMLVGGFVAGFVSVMLRQSKALGLLGMTLVLFATLLGGSRIEVTGEVKSDLYLGLDYTVLLLLTYSLIFIPLEKVFFRLRQSVFRNQWGVDLTYFVVNTVLVELTTFLTLMPAAVLFGWAVNPDLQSWVQDRPVWLQVIALAFLADLAQYWAHRVFHTVPRLWRFHAIHHSTETMDWLAGSRTHFVDVVVTRALIYLPAFLLGFSPAAVVGYLVFVSLHAVLAHANVRFRFGWLDYVLTTPRFHHWHHGIEKEAVNKNYAIHFPVLDMLFGTFYLPKGGWPSGYGVRGNDVPTGGYLRQFIYPFRAAKPDPADPPSPS